MIIALGEADYKRLVDSLKERFPSDNQKEQELEETVDRLVEYFPLYKP